MKRKTLILIFVIILILSFFIYYSFGEKGKLISPLGNTPKEKPLDKYTFENLRKANFKPSEITIGKLLKEENGFNSYMFYYKVKDEKGPLSARFAARRARQVSGLINLPNKEGIYPVIVMLRGYVDREKYTTGEGTRWSAEEIAAPPAGGGFITLAPDFLGYGESDKPSSNSIEERFQTYTTALTLLASVKNLNKTLDHQCHADQALPDSASPKIREEIPKQVRDDDNKVQDYNLCNIKSDAEKVGIWGHSNGGHIALSILAISGKNYPTVLWAPVSKPFPYSILYFTDEFDDHGKALRRAVADFEKDYDIEKYSPTNYLSWINSPIQLHQAVEDEAVPKRWSDQLNQELKKLNKDITYYTYFGENHNFNNGSWGLAIQRSINFYNEKLRNP